MISISYSTFQLRKFFLTFFFKQCLGPRHQARTIYYIYNYTVQYILPGKPYRPLYQALHGRQTIYCTLHTAQPPTVVNINKPQLSSNLQTPNCSLCNFPTIYVLYSVHCTVYSILSYLYLFQYVFTQSQILVFLYVIRISRSNKTYKNTTSQETPTVVHKSITPCVLQLTNPNCSSQIYNPKCTIAYKPQLQFTNQ